MPDFCFCLRCYLRRTVICEELKFDPREAREHLRGAVRDGKHPALAKSHKPRIPWQWEKGPTAEKEARVALKK